MEDEVSPSDIKLKPPPSKADMMKRTSANAELAAEGSSGGEDARTFPPPDEIPAALEGDLAAAGHTSTASVSDSCNSVMYSSASNSQNIQVSESSVELLTVYCRPTY